MGISEGTFRLLLEEKKEWGFEGRILQLGRQCVYFSYETAQQLAALHGVSLHAPKEIRLSFHEELAACGYLDDSTLFQLLGFEDIESLDGSTYEEATHQIDFNQTIPQHLENRYDVVYDGGTLEHIFHLPRCLENIHHLLKVGGKVIHQNPTNNHVDHGFYMFSPRLYASYYDVNHYDILSTFYLKHCPYRGPYAPLHVYSYEPGSFHPSPQEGHNGLIWFIARKTSESTSGQIPQQLYGLTSETPVKSSRFKRMVKVNYRGIYRFLKGLKRFLPRKPRLKKIAKY